MKRSLSRRLWWIQRSTRSRGVLTGSSRRRGWGKPGFGRGTQDFLIKLNHLKMARGRVDGFISRTQRVDVYEGEDRVRRTMSRERVGMMRRDRSVSRRRRRSTSRGRLGERRSVSRERYRTRNQRRSALEKDQAQGDQLREGVLGGHHREVA